MGTRGRWLRMIALGVGYAALVACQSTRPTYLESGAKGYIVSCKGVFSSWESCLVKAGRICTASGYTTVRSDEFNRTMLVSCKNS